MESAGSAEGRELALGEPCATPADGADFSPEPPCSPLGAALYRLRRAHAFADDARVKKWSAQAQQEACSWMSGGCGGGPGGGFSQAALDAMGFDEEDDERAARGGFPSASAGRAPAECGPLQPGQDEQEEGDAVAVSDGLSQAELDALTAVVGEQEEPATKGTAAVPVREQGITSHEDLLLGVKRTRAFLGPEKAAAFAALIMSKALMHVTSPDLPAQDKSTQAGEPAGDDEDEAGAAGAFPRLLANGLSQTALSALSTNEGDEQLDPWLVFWAQGDRECDQEGATGCSDGSAGSSRAGPEALLARVRRSRAFLGRERAAPEAANAEAREAHHQAAGAVPGVQDDSAASTPLLSMGSPVASLGLPVARRLSSKTPPRARTSPGFAAEDESSTVSPSCKFMTPVEQEFAASPCNASPGCKAQTPVEQVATPQRKKRRPGFPASWASPEHGGA